MTVDVMRKQIHRPKLSECSTNLGGMTWCETHKQENAACIQMAEGNLCHICLDWHHSPRCNEVDTNKK